MNDRYMIDFKTYLKLHKPYMGTKATNEQDLVISWKTAEKPADHPFLLLLPTELKGYNLRTKKWGKTYNLCYL
jgi:hypothetical protein